MHYMNPVYQSTYGFAGKDLGKSLFELFDPQIAVDYHINNQRVIKSGKPIETIEKGVKANGETQVLKIYKFPLPVNGRTMVGGWAADITDQVELQEKLIQSVERYEYVNEATSDAIYDWNIATGRIYRGAGYETLFGYTQREVSLKTRISLVHPDDCTTYKQTLFKALRDRHTDRWKIEYRLKDAHGKYKMVVDKAFIIRDNGQAVRVIGAVQDITAQHHLQKKLVNQEKHNKREIIKSIIEAQEKERRQLSVELHDNVNQMLASCKLMLEVARENKPNAKVLTEKAYQSIQTVINEIRRISHDLNPSAISDLGLVEAIEQLIDKINISGKVSIDFAPDRRQYKHYLNHDDKIAIFRMVQEQLTNILKHSGATHVWITLCLVEDTVKLCIKDNGIGFDLSKCKKGLGLRNIYNRIEYYGGTINIKTAHGQGVEMCIALKATSKYETQLA
jgi:PAS domain S-box-containing protein